jgi:predicted metal-dependent peptidase
MSLAHQKITKARTQLLLDNPFFGNIAMRLNLVETDQFDTMATDGKRILFNPAFVDKHSNAHLKGVVAHEVCHVIFKHHLRRGQRDQNNWNVAADYAINSILVDAGFSLPEDGLIDLAWRGQSAEDIYGSLFKDQPEPPAAGQQGDGESPKGGDAGDAQGDAQGNDAKAAENGGSQDAPALPAQSGNDQPVDIQGHGVVIDGTNDDGSALSAADVQEQDDQWTEVVLSAAMISGEAGKEDSPFKQHIDILRRPQVDWRSVLRRFLLDGRPAGTTYQRLGRRSRAVGVPLPSRRVDVGGEIAVLLDVSSSVDDEMFAQFCEELQLIASEFDITSHVIKFTHRVRDVQVVEAGDEIDRTRFYGGTNTKGAFEHVDEQDLDVDAIIVFSDCEDYWDQIPEPSHPTLIAACIQHEHWLETIEKQADWAQIVQISR